jgi:hypothetical protein
MKKLGFILIQIFILFVFSGCTQNNTQTTDPISVSIQQLGKKDSVIKITNKDELNIILKLIQSIRWTSNTPMPTVPKENGIIIFQYQTYNENNKLSDGNPYKIWINDDNSITVESFKGKIGTISKEEMAKYDVLFKYIKIKR